MDAGDDKWVDRDSGPVVRPYALTGGRTEPATGEMLDLIAIVVAARRGAGDLTSLGPEYRKILALCGEPVADPADRCTAALVTRWVRCLGVALPPDAGERGPQDEPRATLRDIALSAYPRERPWVP